MKPDDVSAVAILKKPMLFATIGLFGLSALMGILFIITAPPGDAWQILATTTLLAFFSLFTMNNILRLDSKGIIKVLASLAMLSNVVWTVLWFILIWNIDGGGASVMWKMIWISTSLSICLTLTGSFIDIKQASAAINTLRITAIGSAWFLFIYITPAIIESALWEYISDTWQLIAVVSILFAFSTITTAILKKLQSNRIDTEASLREQIKNELRAEVEAEFRGDINKTK